MRSPALDTCAQVRSLPSGILRSPRELPALAVRPHTSRLLTTPRASPPPRTSPPPPPSTPSTPRSTPSSPYQVSTVIRTSGQCQVLLTNTECLEHASSNGEFTTVYWDDPAYPPGCSKRTSPLNGKHWQWNANTASTVTCDSAGIENCPCGVYKAWILPVDVYPVKVVGTNKI